MIALVALDAFDQSIRTGVLSTPAHNTGIDFHLILNVGRLGIFIECFALENTIKNDVSNTVKVIMETLPVLLLDSSFVSQRMS